MLSNEAIDLIKHERERTEGKFLGGVDLDAYIRKLSERSEIYELNGPRGLAGFVAFYCNDYATKQAFISLVIVNPIMRGAGIGKLLINFALTIARKRGFVSCGLEVAADNIDAIALYGACGFSERHTEGNSCIMAIHIA